MMFSQLKFRGKALIVLGLLATVPFYLWIKNHKSLGFSLDKITSSLPALSQWQIPQPPEEECIALKELFDQPFVYLAAGSQSYAFVSEDGKYVVKFFRMKHLIPSLSDRIKPGKFQRREDNLQKIFSAYKQAYEELRSESGLVYIHLAKTDYLNQTIQVKDRLGRAHSIDLDQTEFIVQEKAELIFSHLKKLQDRGDAEGVQKAVAAVLDLVRRRIEKGYGDQDKAVSHNYGFVGDQPIHLDIGRIYKGQKEGEYERIETRIAKWLDENKS